VQALGHRPSLAPADLIQLQRNAFDSSWMPATLSSLRHAELDAYAD
jgi:adenosine deaminase